MGWLFGGSDKKERSLNPKQEKEVERDLKRTKLDVDRNGGRRPSGGSSPYDTRREIDPDIPYDVQFPEG